MLYIYLGRSQGFGVFGFLETQPGWKTPPLELLDCVFLSAFYWVSSGWANHVLHRLLRPIIVPKGLPS